MEQPKKEYPYVYHWRNNPVRELLYGRRCRIARRLKLNSVLLEFEDGEQVVTSRTAIRRMDDEVKDG
jgi:hypothetical protein